MQLEVGVIYRNRDKGNYIFFKPKMATLINITRIYK